MLLEKERRHGIRSLAIPPILMYHMWNTLVFSYLKNGIGFDGDVTLKEESLKVRVKFGENNMMRDCQYLRGS